jgi:hypothetical protein
MANHRLPGSHSSMNATPRIEVHLCVPDDQAKHMPKRRRAPSYLPLLAPLPRRGETVYLSSTSAWLVEHVIHEWLTPIDLRIEVWLTFAAGAARHDRHPDFAMTQ